MSHARDRWPVLPALPPRPGEQLLLPLALPPTTVLPTTPVRVLPAHVWQGLTPALQRQMRQTLLRVVQEVLHDA
jgi:hypothetical protein